MRGDDEGLSLNERRMFNMEQRMNLVEIDIAAVRTTVGANKETLDEVKDNAKWAARWAFSTAMAVAGFIFWFVITHPASAHP